MPTYIHPTINIVAPTTKALGSSDTATLLSLFPGAPGAVDYPGTAGAAAYKEIAQNLLLTGETSENLQAGTVDRDFGANASDSVRQPPTYGAVPTGGGGLPASAWVPNPISPGPGSADPADQAAAPAGYGTTPTNSLANLGSSTDVTQPGRDPKTSSDRMSLGEPANDYQPGRSTATANS